mmetsp:Transcript_138736/g.431574  ORF Transcript_138736/g.431574 Transcript_138736/m.431574 type:complete len:252 (-) Transcript_138736:261-1016(-)
MPPAFQRERHEWCPAGPPPSPRTPEGGDPRRRRRPGSPPRASPSPAAPGCRAWRPRDPPSAPRSFAWPPCASHRRVRRHSETQRPRAGEEDRGHLRLATPPRAATRARRLAPAASRSCPAGPPPAPRPTDPWPSSARRPWPRPCPRCGSHAPAARRRRQPGAAGPPALQGRRVSTGRARTTGTGSLASQSAASPRWQRRRWSSPSGRPQREPLADPAPLRPPGTWAARPGRCGRRPRGRAPSHSAAVAAGR